jgi:hypothetical protein
MRQTTLGEKLLEKGIPLLIRAQGVLGELLVQRDSKRPRQVQWHRLKSILRANEKTEFAKQFDFAKIKSIADFQAKVPVLEYENLRPYIETQDRDHTPSLTAEAPLYFACTSGTTGKAKLLPVLESTLKRQKRIQMYFIYNILRERPKFLSGKILSLVSPAVEGFVEGSWTPFGSTSGHFYESMPAFFRSRYVVPAKLFAIENYDLKYLSVLRVALSEDNITFMSTANPSTWARLLKLFHENAAVLLNDLEKGSFFRIQDLKVEEQRAILPYLKANKIRAAQLKALWLKEGRLRIKDLWPNVQAVASWTGGSCSIFWEQLAGEFPEQTLVRDLGYLSSEFRGSIPLSGSEKAGLPTFRTNFLEFVKRDDWDDGKRDKFLLIDELEDGAQYYIFVTNEAGLYRYHMNDIVEVDGYLNKVPLIRFVQKGKGVTNITGEKLYENQIIHAVAEAEKAEGLSSRYFQTLADEENSCYRLYYEVNNESGFLSSDKIAALAARIDAELAEINLEYATKRNSGRLKPLELLLLEPGTFDEFKAWSIAQGQREGQFKIVALQYLKEMKFSLEKHLWQAKVKEGNFQSHEAGSSA